MQNGHFNGCVTPSDCWCEPKKYGVVIAVVLMTFFVQAVGAWISNSLALGSDTAHLFMDNLALFVSFTTAIVVKLSPSSEGAYRKQGGKINVWLLRIIAIFILGGAVVRIFIPPEQIIATVMTPIAIAGLVGNFIQREILHMEKYAGKGWRGVIVLFFHEAGHFIHQYPSTLKYMVNMVGYGKRDHTHELQNLHILWDLTYSVIVIIAGFLILVTGVLIIDTVSSVAIACLMFFSTSKLMDKLVHGNEEHDHGHHLHHH